MRTKIVTLAVYCLLAYWHSICAGQISGYVIEWGWNTAAGKAMPAQAVLSNAVAISAGRIQCLALKDDGTVISWGGNFRGQASFNNTVLTTGEGGFTDKSGFHITSTNTTTIITNGVVKIDGKVLNSVIAVAVGSEFGIGLKRDGTVVAWGENYVPTGLTNVQAIAATGLISLALKMVNCSKLQLEATSLPQRWVKRVKA